MRARIVLAFLLLAAVANANSSGRVYQRIFIDYAPPPPLVGVWRQAWFWSLVKWHLI